MRLVVGKTTVIGERFQATTPSPTTTSASGIRPEITATCIRSMNLAGLALYIEAVVKSAMIRTLTKSSGY